MAAYLANVPHLIHAAALAAVSLRQNRQVILGQTLSQTCCSGGRRSTATISACAGTSLGSASLTTDGFGNKASEMRYSPWGEPRLQSNELATDRRFTGQGYQAALGSLYDYGARLYSPLLGRFISADTIVPGASNPQAWNRYSYTFNNPLAYVDVDGHIPYPITIRSFAPFAEFGALFPGGSFHGDNRGFSASPSVTSRVNARINFDTDATTVSISARSDPSWQIANPQDVRTEKPRSQVLSPLSIVSQGSTRTFSFQTWYGGSNPFLPPYVPRELSEIDVFASFTIVENKAARYLDIAATLTGDNFPATEAFISDPSGQSVFIGIGFYQPTNKDTGPLEALPGANQRSISKLKIRVGLNRRGNFASVTWNGRTYTVPEWNRRFIMANPHDRSSHYGR